MSELGQESHHPNLRDAAHLFVEGQGEDRARADVRAQTARAARAACFFRTFTEEAHNIVGSASHARSHHFFVFPRVVELGRKSHHPNLSDVAHLFVEGQGEGKENK